MYKIKYDNKKLVVEALDKSSIIELTNKKYFHNDIIDKNGNIITSLNRTKLHVGYISTSSITTFGKTKSGKKLYKLTSLNYKLPDFMVSYNGKLQGKILIIFKFLNWNKKIPQASIVNVIGFFNETNILYAYVYYYNLVLKKNKIKSTINILENNITRKNIEYLYTISIDPDGSLDIDDAISLDDENIYISIAQPISYMNLSDLIKTSKNRFSTLYLGIQEISLFGNDITKKASLLKNKVKNCYTLKFNKDGKLVDHFPARIKVNKNLSYKFVNTNRNNFNNLFNFSTKIFGDLPSAQKLVEKWMIHCNCIIGELLDYTIYRNNYTNITILKNMEPNDKKFFYDASEYHYSNKSYHNILNVGNYLHFTSPIRRIVDNFIHYQLTYKKSLHDLINKSDQEIKYESISKLIQNINLISKNTAKLHRTINLRCLLKSQPQISNHLAKIVKIDSLNKCKEINYIVLLIPKIGKFKYYIPDHIDSNYIKKLGYINLNNFIKIQLGIVNNFYCNKMVIIKTQFDILLKN